MVLPRTIGAFVRGLSVLDTVTRFLSKQPQDAIVSINTEPSLCVCGIVHWRWRTFATKFTDNRKLAFARLKTVISPRPAKISSMGIRGLTHFVHSTKNLWTTIDLQDTKLVTDGLALNCCLFENSGLDYRCGGQYDEFYQAVVAFFVALKSSHVDCFVVFDGAIDPSGKNWRQSRSEQRRVLKLSTNCLHLVISMVLYHFHFCLLMCLSKP